MLARPRPYQSVDTEHLFSIRRAVGHMIGQLNEGFSLFGDETKDDAEYDLLSAAWAQVTDELLLRDAFKDMSDAEIRKTRGS